MATQSASYVGRSMRRREDRKFLTRRGRYVDDIALAGMLYLAIHLRSPHAHARITGIDLSAARAAAGVRLALAGADLCGKIGNIKPNWVIPGTVLPDRPVVAVDRVRFVGECVALVVGETREAASDALELIDVAYEALPVVINEEAAIAEGATQLHENVPHNITTYFKTGGGDYAAAVRQADHVLRLRLVNNRLIPTCLETRAILAEPGVDGRVTMYLPSQVPHMHRRWIAETVDIPEHLLRVVAPDIGGGFGAKMHLYPEELLCAWLARELKSPVKWCLAGRQLCLLPHAPFMLVSDVACLEGIGLRPHLQDQIDDVLERQVVGVRPMPAAPAQVVAHLLLGNADKRVVDGIDAQPGEFAVGLDRRFGLQHRGLP